jgi:hypothetical protein
MAARAAVLVPRLFAVCGMNWMSPVAPDRRLTAEALKLRPVSKAMTAIRMLGSRPRRPASAMALRRN